MALAAMLIATQAAAVPAGNFPLGDWYMEKHGKAFSLYSVDRIYANGAWVSEFLECFAGKSRTHVESGTWVYKDSHLTLTTSLIGGVYKVRVEHYDILSHDQYRFAATTVGNDKFWFTPSQSFTETRVSHSSKLPGCDPVS
ncbi:MAG TPA: hypothetical protein VHW02_09465 [Rhizomicrobium sp.]|jgi:hypothetical protein|nr:hypothetical protein [Rhizomicrobium sp.]